MFASLFEAHIDLVVTVTIVAEIINLICLEINNFFFNSHKCKYRNAPLNFVYI